MTDLNPGDVFSLSDTEEVMVEVNVNDVPETGDIMPSEEEQLIDEQAPGNVATTEQQTDGATGTTPPKTSDTASLVPITSSVPGPLQCILQLLQPYQEWQTLPPQTPHPTQW